MKIRDLLALDHNAARKLSATIAGAKEVPTAPDAPLVEVSDAVSDRFYAEAVTLYGEAVRHGLLLKSEYGIEDFRLESEIVAAIAELTVNRPDPDHDDDIATLERLWGVLPGKYRKKTGKVLRVEGQTVTLTLRPGRRKYVFTFPLSHFE